MGGVACEILNTEKKNIAPLEVSRAQFTSEVYWPICRTIKLI